MPNIDDAKILIMATDGFEKSELFKPHAELKDAGATVHVASPEKGEIRSWDKTDWGEPISVDVTLEDVSVDDYDVLVLPGGQINPDLLRLNETAVGIVRRFVKARKPVAAICHAPWLLVEAEALRGRRATSYPSIKTDVRNAGAEWVDEEMVHDENLITSRSPDDLPAFIAEIIRTVEGETSTQGRAA